MRGSYAAGCGATDSQLHLSRMPALEIRILDATQRLHDTARARSGRQLGFLDHGGVIRWQTDG
eukprot:4859127-Prymnesium_polylepis.2